MSAVAAVAAVHVPERSWRSELRAVRTVARRDLIRHTSDRLRMVTFLILPLMFLFVLGPGMESLSTGARDDVDLITFMFPGVLCMVLWFSASFNATGLVMDRELGFLRELTVAPVARASILLGRCVGGVAVAMVQALMVLVLAGFAHVPYDPLLLVAIVGLQLLTAFSVTAIGLAIATSTKQAQTFNTLMQVLVMPVMFLSGALYPVSGLPAWMGLVNRLNPLAYAVDAMRRLVFAHLDVSAAARARYAPGITWWGWRLPVALELVLVLLIGLAALALGVARFTRTE